MCPGLFLFSSLQGQLYFSALGLIKVFALTPFLQGIGCTKITKARSEGSVNANSESRSYLEKKLVFCFGSHVASQLLLPFGEENFLSSDELKQAQEVGPVTLCF